MTLAWCGLHRIRLSEFLLQDALRTVLASGWTAPFLMAADMVQPRALSP